MMASLPPWENWNWWLTVYKENEIPEAGSKHHQYFSNEQTCYFCKILLTRTILWVTSLGFRPSPGAVFPAMKGAFTGATPDLWPSSTGDVTTAPNRPIHEHSVHCNRVGVKVRQLKYISDELYRLEHQNLKENSWKKRKGIKLHIYCVIFSIMEYFVTQNLVS